MPFLPIADDNPIRLIKFQIVTAVLISANVVVFLWSQLLDEESLWSLWLSFGLIPSVLTGEAYLSHELDKIPAWATIFTSMFLHSDYLHLGSNMLFLWVFGDNVEDATGHWRFPAFYLLCGVVAALVEVAVFPDSDAPIIGASGAIAGVLGGYVMLHPRRRLLILVMRVVPVRLNVAMVLLVWILVQVGSAVWFGDGDVAWWSHVAGFLAGMALIVLARRRGIPLFDGAPVKLDILYRRHKGRDEP